ncbi:AAA family ATPase [Virgisporangium aurantiacum]
MDGTAAEIAAEQAYFDLAAEFRGKKLAGLDDLATAGANPGAAARIKRYANAAREALQGADQAVAFGRIDGRFGLLYIGRQLINGTEDDPLVVSWHAPAAAAYFEASHADTKGVDRKRVFECDGNTIVNLTDVVFADVAEAVDTHLLAELARGRTGRLRDIVATLQAAQYALVRAPADRLLVIEGGPGTGKTAVALHRVSWLLYHHRDTIRATDVLVVGPHPTFMHYIGLVLPGLGSTEVVMRDIGRLAPEVTRGRVEPVEVATIKGQARMAGLLARALDARIGVPEPAERLMIGSRFYTLPHAEVAAAIEVGRSADLPYTGRREVFRDRIDRLVSDLAGAASAGRQPVADLVERLWPRLSAGGFLRDLFGSLRRLRAAAGADFTAAEIALLHRRAADRLTEEVWSAADLPLLDEAGDLIDGDVHRYAHIVVDEAQDLSPMQLRSVARRSATGALTIVGDIAQSTGPWARDTWDEVVEHLPTASGVEKVPLRYGYRVPRQVYEMAARLLPVAAPAVAPVEVIRDGPQPPTVHQVGLAGRAGRTVTVAIEHAAGGRFVGIVCPPRCRRETEAALAANGATWSSAERGELGTAINLVSPEEAKGLEFDAVVVVEPEQIVADYERGHRMLYVALTRTTAYLDIVCVGDPLPLSLPATPKAPAGDDPGGFSARQAQHLAEHLAGQLRAAAPETEWQAVLRRVGELLDPS